MSPRELPEPNHRTPTAGDLQQTTSFCILQQELMSPRELPEPNHRSGPFTEYEESPTSPRSSEARDIICGRESHVWGADRNVMSLV